MRNWKFALEKNGGFEGAELPGFDDSGWRTLDLPHDWQVENNRDPDMEGGDGQGFFPRCQRGWYRRCFDAPPAWKDKWVRVRFDGVQRFSTVYLNGVELGGRPYGYVPFDVDLNRALKYGEENVLAVKVDNTKGGGDRWYSGAGIYRPVEVSVTDKVFIPRDGVRVSVPRLDGEAARVRVSAGVDNRSGGKARGEIRGRIEPPRSGAPALEFTLPYTVGVGESAAVETEIEIKNPLRWDIDDPALYGLSLYLGEDCSALRFGLRETRFDGEEGFFLNGRSRKLQGVNLHHDGGALGAAVPEAVWRRRFSKLKGLGCNAIRCSHNPQAEQFYDLADEMGFLVIDEVYDKWAPSGMYYREFFDDWWERDLEAMIRRDRNHPSVILWSVGNEVEYQNEESFYGQLARMCDKARSLDPSRPVSAALINPRESWPLEQRINALMRYAEIVDVLMLNYQESYYAALRRAGLSKAIIGSEVYTYYRSSENQITNRIVQPPWRDVVKNKFAAGAFLWAGIDYLGESTGWPCRGWTGAALDSAGFEKIRSWYLASQWKEEPVLKLAVFDETEPYDMARRYWDFPQMRRRWNYPPVSPVKRVAAITNCDLVKLYVNDEPVREAAPDLAGDGMAHFTLAYSPGAIRAEGFRNGLKVIEDILHTACRAASVEIAAPPRAAPGETLPLEIWLKDKYGEPWVLDNPGVWVKVSGDAELVALDNGDFCSAEVYAAGNGRFWNGHILALIRMGDSAGPVRITVLTEGMNPASHRVELEGSAERRYLP
jgi:beta-galactosidase